jgi:membrane-associated PAP2 superfamily phosphatase
VTREGRFDLVVTVGALLLLAAWDVSGADLTLSHWIAGPAGFPWRDAWLTRVVLHDGGRWLSGLVLAVLTLAVWRRSPAGPSRAARFGALGVVLLGLVVVPSLKRASATSCPWDLAEFGGTAHYVSHWQFGLADGGPGHCFPSGHAVAAFAFVALYFLWRPHQPGRARAWLAGTLVVGAVFGVAQWLRGAHYVSHVLWAAWICWTVAALAFRLPAWAGAAARLAGVCADVPTPAPAAARPGRRGDGRRSAARSARRRRSARSRR